MTKVTPSSSAANRHGRGIGATLLVIVALLVALVAAAAVKQSSNDGNAFGQLGRLGSYANHWQQWTVMSPTTSAGSIDHLPSEGEERYAICTSKDDHYGRRVYTGEIDTQGEAISFACLAIEGNRVAKAGEEDAIRDWCTSRGGEEGCQMYRIQAGQSIVPGLHDGHGHILDLGWARSAVDLVGASSRKEVVERIEAYVKARPDLLKDRSRWIQGLGWDQTKWTPSSFPLAEEFESSTILQGRKIMLRRIDVHALWLSRAALDLMEESGVMPAPDEEVDGGLVLRNERTGRASGCLIDKAMDLAYKVIPPWTDDDRSHYLEAAAEELLSVGITSVGDAAVDLDSIAFYKRRQEDRQGGRLPVRVYAFMACPPDQVRCAHLALEQGLPIHAKPFTDDRLTVRTVKLFADGALGSWGSAMFAPYDDKPDWRGLMLIKEKEVYPLIRYWVLAGWNVATHCIGDRAQSIALTAYERILQHDKLVDANDARFRIEHAQIVRRQDIARFAASGVIASMQPTHCTSDMAYVEERIGRRRAEEGAYAWSSFVRANATLALGSDFPVELPNPIHGFYSAVTRLDDRQSSPHGQAGWYPDQRLTRAQALHGFTVAPAFAQFEEDVGGSLTGGKRADFVILNDDLLRQTDLRRLRATETLATFIDGKIVWRRKRSA